MNASNKPLFDAHHVRSAFSRAASSYGDAAKLQKDIEQRTLEALDYYAEGRDSASQTPQAVLDLGCGPGNASLAMRDRWPLTQIVALDLALPMLKLSRREAQVHSPLWKRLFASTPTRPAISSVCADARALPFADNSFDVVFSNLCLQWVEDLPAMFAGLRRVLKPGGMLVCSTFGHDTLHELRTAFEAADSAPHVSPFASIAQFGDAMVAAGFRNPVLDRDVLITYYDDLRGLMRELRAIGATNALHTRRRTLTGRARFVSAANEYERFRERERLPATWEVITAIAWAPDPGAPIREGNTEIASFPASSIPVRRRSS